MNTAATRTLPAAYTFIFAAAALAFLALLGLEIAGIGRTVLKAIPVTTLLVLVLREMDGAPRVFLAGALIGSVAGDILLDIPQNLFIFGLVAFLVGHLFYTVHFFRHATRPNRTDRAIIAGLIVFAGATMWLFSGIDPSLYPPVVAYISVIVTMSIGALMVPAESRLLFGGALLFIASDLVLAVNKFLVPIPHGRLVNISLYFIAQYVIIAAALGIWARSRSTAPVPRRASL